MSRSWLPCWIGRCGGGFPCLRHVSSNLPNHEVGSSDLVVRRDLRRRRNECGNPDLPCYCRLHGPYNFYLLLAIALSGLAIALTLYLLALKHHRHLMRAEAEAQCEEKQRAVRMAVEKRLGSLVAISSVIQSSSSIDQQQFSRLSDALVGWTRNVRNRLWVRAAGNLQVSPSSPPHVGNGTIAGERHSSASWQEEVEGDASQALVTFVDGPVPDFIVLGMDLLNDSKFRLPLMRAKESGLITMTGPFTMENAKRSSMAFLAVYDSPKGVRSMEAKSRACLGFAAVTLDVSDIIEDVLGQVRPRRWAGVTRRVWVWDATLPGAELVYPPQSPSSVMSGDWEEHTLRKPLDLGDPSRQYEIWCTVDVLSGAPLYVLLWLVFLLVFVAAILLILCLMLQRLASVTKTVGNMQVVLRETEAAKKAAIDADLAKSTFIATMSHEIRTPMNGVIGCMSLLLGTNLDATQMEYVMTAKSSGKALISLINDVLDFSKIEAGRMELECVAFNLRAEIDDVLSLFGEKTREKKLELSALVQDPVPKIILGVPLDVRSKLFRPFTQGHSSTSRHYGGTGIGLSICHKLVSLMGGRMGFISTPGKGSSFIFEIPCRVQEPGASGPDPGHSSAASLVCAELKGVRAVVVDDDEVRIAVVCSYLRQLGVHPHVAYSATEAISMLTSNGRGQNAPFRFTIIDNQIDGGSGLRVGKQIHEELQLCGLPLLLLTESPPDKRADDEIKRCGFSAWIGKPLRHSPLVTALATAVFPDSVIGATPWHQDVNKNLADFFAAKHRKAMDSVREFNIEVLDPLTSEDFAWLPLPTTGRLRGPQCAALCAHLHTYLSFYAPPTSPTDDEVAVGDILAYTTKVAREFHTQWYDDNNAPLMYVRIQVGQASCSALLDSGASRNFMSQSFMQRAGLGAQVRRKANPTAIKLADGKTQLLDRYIEAVPVYFAPHACEPVTFDILDTDFDIILGMPWLASADHTVNFHRRTLSVCDAFGAEVACTIPLPHPSIRCQVVKAKSLRATCAYEQPEEIGLCFLRTVAVADASATDLSSDSRVVRLLDEFADIFESPTGVVPDRPISHEIILGAGAVPPKGCIYRMREEELEVFRAQLDDLLAKGWIRPSSSPYGAPVLFARKKNKDLRLCIDYRKLDAQTVKNVGPLPRIDDLLERLGGAKYFSKLDLKSGYHQISIRPNDRYKSAFKTRYGHFEWVVMPFGLPNAPTAFQVAMTNEFCAILDRFVLVYLDDILVYSRRLEDHLGHLRRVLETLRCAKYKANRDKCEFFRQELEYLGHFVTPEGISPLSDKIQAIQEWPEPRNVTDVRSFLGLARYYQCFIKGYSKIAAHLTKFQCEDRPLDFGEEARESFLALKAALLSVEVLRIYDPLLPTRLITDASGYGIGYFSKKVPVVHSIDNARKELLVFVHALKQWRHFLLGRSPFRWVTDNNPLVFYKTQDTVNSTIARWMAFIDQFDFFPDHIPGKSNRFADALSRRPDHCTVVYSTCGTASSEATKPTPSFVTSTRIAPLLIRRLLTTGSKRGTFLSTRGGRTFFAYRVILTCVHDFWASSTMLPPPDTLESIARLANFASDFGGPAFSATSLAIASHARFADAENPATIVRMGSYDHYRSCCGEGKRLPWALQVVDDNLVNRIVATKMLKQFGFEVIAVSRGSDAIELMTPCNHGFDVIFMDVQMPEIDGYEATREIRRLEREVHPWNQENMSKTSGVKIIACTADVLKGTLEQCIREGMDDYVPKPISSKQLRAALRRAFGLHQDEQ
ncbi:hypothetical protein CBR_g15972 [Chara braunii]|uniref:Uncharacterized protein n=1 Tax=Chara braunii TaxID=69332 RepID=A0A388JST7_CHABU|nr:hypothetical protein CBR_g15972 [Chara braunii]|eukprot:GBG60851.1 hypothetical protein CBR_g15972 [Chara braunii]